MTINYPNGSAHHPFQKKNRPSSVNYGKRGMTLEELISQSNDYYRSKNQAVIYKKPTPIQVVHVDYPRRSRAVITEAYYRKASTTDYNGIYQGFYIDFEAKETKNKTTFPLSNFQQHQIEHLKQCQEHGGICFALLSFSQLQRFFVLPSKKLCYYWDNHFKDNHPKSISLKELEKHGIEIKYSIAPVIPYLDAVDQMIQEKMF